MADSKDNDRMEQKIRNFGRYYGTTPLREAMAEAKRADMQSKALARALREQSDRARKAVLEIYGASSQGNEERADHIRGKLLAAYPHLQDLLGDVTVVSDEVTITCKPGAEEQVGAAVKDLIAKDVQRSIGVVMQDIDDIEGEPVRFDKWLPTNKDNKDNGEQ
jgi:RecA/RadA recombinase